MPPRGYQLPPDSELGTGAKRNLTLKLFALYEAAGKPSREQMVEWAGRDVSADAFARLLRGKTDQPAWHTVRTVAAALVRQGPPGAGAEFDETEIRTLWQRLGGDARPVPVQPPRFESGMGLVPAGNAAEAFARSTFDWASEVHRVRAAVPRGGQGAVTISAREVDLAACRRVFEVDLHHSLERLCDQKVLIPARTTVVGEFRFGPSSVAYFGRIRSGNHKIRGVLAIEASAFGAVTVYFREPGEADSDDVLVDFWIRGAMRTALHVIHMLGWIGTGDAATLIDVRTIAASQTSPFSSPSPDPFWDDDLPAHPYVDFQTPLCPTYHGPLDLVPSRFTDFTDASGWVERAADDFCTGVRGQWNAQLGLNLTEVDPVRRRAIRDLVSRGPTPDEPPASEPSGPPSPPPARRGRFGRLGR